jgi:protein-disulfide isomerase
MKLSGETKFFIGVFLVTFLIIIAAVFLISQPTPLISKDKLIPPGTHTKGNTQAQTYLVEFSDFQCPACVTYKPIIDAILNKYQDKILFAYRHYPLEQHQFAYNAALSSEYAASYGKFWEMYEYLFSSSENLSDTVIAEGIKKIGVDQNDWMKLPEIDKFKSRINKDKSDGDQFGLNATPTFFLNGRKLNLTTQEDLETEVAREINK